MNIRNVTATILNINNITSDEKNNVHCQKLSYPMQVKSQHIGKHLRVKFLFAHM